MKTEKEIKEKAERYIIDYGGTMLQPGPVIFYREKGVWIVPIFYGPKFSEFPLDEMEFNEDGDLVYAPSSEKLSKLIRVRFNLPSKEELEIAMGKPV